MLFLPLSFLFTHTFICQQQGIFHLQRAGVCHRDISLENIMIHDGKPVIIDFGIALRVPMERRRLRHLIVPDTDVGKQYYVSPEIALSRDPYDGFAVDLWAVGVILFIFLTGCPPWSHPFADLTFELIAISRNRLESLLVSWDRAVSPEATDLLQRMLRLDPRERLSLAQVAEHPWMTMDG